MAAGVVGFVLIVVVAVVGRIRGTEAWPSSSRLGVAAFFFAASLLAPALAVQAPEMAWIVVGAVAAAVGYLLVVGAVLATSEPRSTRPPGTESAPAAKRGAGPTEGGGFFDRVEDPFDAETGDEDGTAEPSR